MIRTKAFTLIEVLIVVVMISILAATAVPQFLDTEDSATESVLKHNLDVIRGAIQRYRIANDGVLPGQDKVVATFKNELATCLTTPIPANPFDEDGNMADKVRFRRHGDPLVDHVGGTHGWLYDNTTGEFIANTDDISANGVTKYSEF